MRQLRVATMTWAMGSLLIACSQNDNSSTPPGGDSSGPAPDAVARVVLSETALTLGVGDTRQISARVENAWGATLDKPVTWASDTPATVSVADGLITALAAGAAAITASADGVHSAPLAVTVRAATGTLYVANGDHGNASLLAYEHVAEAATGADPTRHIGSDVRTLAGAFLDTAADRLFVVSAGNGAILVYDSVSTKDGPLASDRKIAGPTTYLYKPTDIVADLSGDKFYVTDSDMSWVYTFTGLQTASGDTAPTAVLNGSSTGLSGNASLALDATRHRLYVGNKTSITVYDATQTLDGDVAPIATITGSTTGLADTSALLFDARNDALFVADYTGNAVRVFTGVSTLNGDVAPARTITGSTTALAGPRGLALDVTGGRDLLYVSNTTDDKILRFTASTDDGDLAPLATLQPPATLGSGYRAVIDGGRDTLYRLEATVSEQDSQVSAYTGASTASGSVTAARSITSPATFSKIVAMTVDGTADRGLLLAVSRANDVSIQAYDDLSTKSGDLAASRVVAGASTALAGGIALAGDAGRDTVYVAATAGILVFSGAAAMTGDLAPTRQFKDSAWAAAALAVDADRDLLYVLRPPGSVLAFATASTLSGGSTSPSHTLTGLDAGGCTVAALTVDPAADRLFVACGGSAAIDVLDQASTLDGAVTATRTITATAMSGTPTALAYYETPDLLTVGTANALVVIPQASIANGASSSARKITGTYWILAPGALAADAAH